ncbi:MAG: polysaccharide biosynthesis C-terminal domain-containing protein [Marinilabiliaceae bacterium]|nr:polysaccharide biosynthesis C-terminal domain-containing protein [Marinilabiliaceae bacterium]
MQIKVILKTIFSRTGIVVLNFLIVLITTRIWGAEGRGNISIVMADISLIVIVNNVFTSSSISYFTPRMQIYGVWIVSMAWIVFFSTVLSFFLSFVLGHESIITLLFLSVLISLTNFNLSVILGQQKVDLYNILSFFIPLVSLVLTIITWYFFSDHDYQLFLGIYAFSYIVILGLSFYVNRANFTIHTMMSIRRIKPVFFYGLKNELSYFFQFLNYRFTYFVLPFYVEMKQIGVFSIAIAISESIWIISKSIAIVNYSIIINSDNHVENIRMTQRTTLLSFSVTALIVLILWLIPSLWLSLLFGDEFEDLKLYVMILTPGILIMSASNIMGHYLAGIGQLRALIIKSFLGFIVTLLFFFVFAPILGVVGACITINVSHIATSLVVFIYYRKKLNTIRRSNSHQ